MDQLVKTLTCFLCYLMIVNCESQKPQETDVLINLEQKETTVTELKKTLDSLGYQTFNYISPSTQDTILMQQYFMVFLKSGPQRSQSKSEADSLQTLHLQHLERMFEMGYADISGPFGDSGDIRGITIYNVPNIAMADSLANLDPMVKSGRLVVEVHPWWAAKSICLR